MVQITGKLNLYSYNPGICKNNNGTEFCDAGYRLGTTGLCFSQSLGKLNSTGFEPTYPICLQDYESLLDASYVIHKPAQTLASGVQQLKDPQYGNVSGDFKIESVIQLVSSVASQLQVQYGITGDSVNIQAISIFLSKVGYIVKNDPRATGSFNIHHSGKNVIPHLRNRESQYWTVDTYADVTVVKGTRDKVGEGNIFAASKKSGIALITSQVDSGVSTSTISGENPVSICSDDLTAPTVTGTNPLKYSHLNAVGSFIEFQIVDDVAGVDLGVLQVTVSGSETIQPEGYLVVTSGTDQTGGNVSIVGSPDIYTIRYTPSTDWANNETVTVTISGQDLEPQSGGEDWYCSTPGTRNIFGEEYYIRILDEDFFTASITAVPDTVAPYLDNVSPGRYTRQNSIGSVVQFDIIDDAAGVNINTLNVWVNGILVLENGNVQTSEASIQLLENGYRVRYDADSDYVYGEVIPVRVVVYDNNTNPGPNLADISYFFSIVSDSTLIVESFTPEPYTSYLASSKDICVDVYDASFGVQDAYLQVNGVTYSGTRTDITGVTDITTTVSGVTVISGASYTGTSLLNSYISGATIVGSTILSGTIISADGYGGQVYNLPIPYDYFNSRTLVSGTFVGGTLYSGTVVDSLVSGTNWNGSYDNASIYGVELLDGFSAAETKSTTISGVIGYTICYHPENDFLYEGDIEVNVFAQNNNSSAPVVKNVLHRLYHGYRVLKHRYETGPQSVISIFARALNKEKILNTLSSIYEVTTYPQPSKELTATITAIRPWEDIPATINITSPTHGYGEIITVEFYIEDISGNPFGPYIFSYTIEDSP